MQRGFREADQKPRRFYEAAAVAPAEGGYGIELDGRSLRTPGGTRLVLPTRAAAQQVAEEWAAQGQVIELATMHATRLANTAVDSLAGRREVVANQIAEYAGSDLTCYYAETPRSLVARQQAAWEPMLDRAEREEGLIFVRASGIVHATQPPATLAKVRAIALSVDDFGLAGLAFAAALFGSAVLAVGLLRGWLSGDQAFDLSRVDETFQEEKWGVDAEAAERTERLRGEARMLQRWFEGLGRA